MRKAPLTCTMTTFMPIQPLRFIDLFAGIGGICLAFESIGGKCMFSSEWDAAAQVTYEANFGERPHGDITQIELSSIPDHDILLAGFPVSHFSICSDQKSFDDTRGTLFFDIERILAAKRPPAFLLENVKMLKHMMKAERIESSLNILRHWDMLHILPS